MHLGGLNGNIGKKWVNIDFDLSKISFAAGIYLLKVSDRNTRTRCEICSELTINTPERRQGRRSGVFIVNFEHFSHLTLVFLLVTFKLPTGTCRNSIKLHPFLFHYLAALASI